MCNVAFHRVVARAMGGLFLAAVLSSVALALEGEDINKSIFKKDNAVNLCTKQSNEYVVDRSYLAWALVGENRAIRSITIQKRVLGMARISETEEKKLFFFVSSPIPMGLNPPFSVNPREKAEEERALAQQIAINGAFGQWLRGLHSRNKDFELIGADKPEPDQYFNETDKYRIVCKGFKGEGDESSGAPDTGNASAADGWLKNVVIRKSTADLSVSATELKKANGAQLSYTDDEVKAKKTVAIEGLVGYVIAGNGTTDRLHVMAGAAKKVEAEEREAGKEAPNLY